MADHTIEHSTTTRRTVDALTRTLHALMAASFSLAYVTSEVEGLRVVHVTTGYTLGAVFLIRVIWGVLGPRRVNLRALGSRLVGLSQSLEMVKRFDWQEVLKLVLAASMVTLLLCSMPVVASGYATYLDLLGKWPEEVHETLGNFMLLAVGCHVGFVALLSLAKTERQVRPMITGLPRVCLINQAKSSGKCHSNSLPAPNSRFSPTAAIIEISISQIYNPQRVVVSLRVHE